MTEVQVLREIKSIFRQYETPLLQEKGHKTTILRLLSEIEDIIETQNMEERDNPQYTLFS